MKKKIAILLPYKEKYTLKDSAAASIWVKDYLKKSAKANPSTAVELPPLALFSIQCKN